MKKTKTEAAEEKDRAERRRRREKHAERVKAARARRWDSHFKEGESVATAPMKLNVGGAHNVRHGLYRKLLTDEENEWADVLVEEYAAEHGLTLKSDLDGLRLAVSFFIKACRPEPETRPDDHNVRSYQAFYARQFGEWMDRLGMSRKVRKEDDSRGDMLAAINRLMRGDAPPVIEATAKEALTDGEA